MLCTVCFFLSLQLCADGCDVSNLLSGDPAALRRGCRLEYFLRPPLHVTLHFQVRVELYRVDVELLPCSSASRRLEILTCSEANPAKTPDNDNERGQFKLVGCCELKGEVLTCFMHPKFKLPFPECPPDPPAHAKQQALWSRGPLSLSSVAQLRITVPYSGASSALGIKSLAVWGAPSRCCSPSELEQFQKAHFDSLTALKPSLSPVSTSTRSPKPANASSETTIPEEFLDPLTQELMVLPMILPSGMVVDNSTLEEYEKQEAAWGRMPNDPFSGVPFTKDLKPLPNPLLKRRIDSLLLHISQTGIRSKNSLLNKPQPSRLISASVSQTDLLGVESSQAEGGKKHNILTKNKSRRFEDGQGLTLASTADTSSIRRENLRQMNKRNYPLNFSSNGEHLSDSTLSPVNKMPRMDASISLSTG